MDESGLQIAIGVAVIVGHNWPVFLRFNAGRGLATTIGVAFYLFPWGLWVFALGAVFTLLLGSSPLPVLVGLAALPISQLGPSMNPPELTLGSDWRIFIILVIRRLTAPRTDSFKPGQHPGITY